MIAKSQSTRRNTNETHLGIWFNKLIMHNFLSYAHSEYEFNTSGFIAVKGFNRNNEDNASSNGTGK